MSPFVTCLLLAAALLHAVWNALLRSTRDRLQGTLIINLTCPLLAVPVALWLPLPPAAAWPYIGFSACLTAAYATLLAQAYQKGDLSQVYPVARGSAPLLVTLGALVCAGDAISPASAAGVGLVSLGILGLAEFRHALQRKAFMIALATGFFIAAGTVADGIGVRQVSQPLAYVAWRSLFVTVLLCLIFWRRTLALKLNLREAETQKAVGAGIISLIGNATIVWALARSPMGAVSALRETSVLFAALIGAIWLKEKLTLRRGLACVTIVIGAMLLSWRG